MDMRRISDPLTTNQILQVVSVQEVMAHARITSYDEIHVIARHIVSAYEKIRDFTNATALLNETWEYYPEVAPGRSFEIPARPFHGTTLTAFDVLDSDGTTYSAIPTSDYAVRWAQAHVSLERAGYSWPYIGLWKPRTLRVRFTAGYGTAKKDIPPVLRESIRQLAAHWYAQRETVGSEGREPGKEVPYGVRNLAGKHRFSPDHS